MTALAVLTGFCLALVLVLGWMVVALRRDVATLTAELRVTTDRSEPVVEESAVPQPVVESVEPAPAEPSSSDPQPAVRTVVSLDGRDVDPEPQVDAHDVPVITVMSEPVDDVDLTTRRVASVTLARPLIKVAALSYGVRRALDDEHRLRVRLTMRRELKRQRKMRRRRRADQAPAQGWTK